MKILTLPTKALVTESVRVDGPEITKELKSEDKDGLLPEALETFQDISSDEGISQIAFYGVGQVVLKKSAEAAPAAYEVNT